MNAIEIQQMSTTERLQAMEALWDSLTQSPSELESPDWHKSILAERRQKIEDGTAEFISLDELKSRR